MLELGQARLAADDLLNARQALLDAASTADAIGDAPAMRRAAAGLATTTLWQTSPYGEVHPPVVNALERAIATAEDDTPAAERAGLVGALADALYYDAEPGRSQVLAAEAVRLARLSGDPQTVALALSQRFRSLWRDTVDIEQDEIAAELVDLAQAGRLPAGLAAVAHLTGAVVAFSHADRTAYEARLAAARFHADESSMPALLSQVGWAEATWLVARGRYDEGQAVARETDCLYRRARGWQADDIHSAFELAVGHDRGTLTDPLATARGLLDGDLAAGVREVLGWMLVEDGDLAGARHLVGPAGTVPELPPDWLWVESTTAAAHVRAALGDLPACAALRQRLVPMAGRLDVTAGPFLGGIDLALARVADALGDGPAARRHAADAVATLDRFGTGPALARALLCHGQVLAASADPGDRAAADASLLRARQVADDLGLAPVQGALDRMQAASKVASA
jgi:hypothetical protein